MGTREVYEEKLRTGNVYHHDPTINPGLGTPRCPRCLSLLDSDSKNSEWTITSVLHDATAVFQQWNSTRTARYITPIQFPLKEEYQDSINTVCIREEEGNTQGVDQISRRNQQGEYERRIEKSREYCVSFMLLIYISFVWLYISHAGSGIGAMLSATHGFNTGIPFVQKYVKGPKWLPFVVGLPPLLLSSAACAAFGGYALPKFTQLIVTSYYAASSASHYGISLLTRHIEEAHMSSSRQEKF